jgi:DNA mismatch repair protein MLH1
MQEGAPAAANISCFVFNPSIQAGSSNPDLSSPSSPSVPHAIRLLYGNSIAKDLIHVAVQSEKKSKNGQNAEEEIHDDDDDPEAWTAEAHCTNANYHAKKTIFLLFINRLCLVLFI